jgi:hypothetical protein
MKTIITYNTVKILIVTTIILCSITNAENQQEQTSGKFYPIDANKIPDILSMIAGRVRNNYLRIKTWQGGANAVIDYVYEGASAEKIFKTETDGLGEIPRIVCDHRERIADFALDIEKELLYVNNRSEKPLQYTDLERGRDLGAKGIPGEERSILTKEYYIKCRADKRRNNDVTSRKAVKQSLKDCSGCQKPPVFDPRESFEAGKPVCEILHQILGKINKDGEWKVDRYGLKVEEHKVGDVTQYRIIIPSKITENDILFSTLVFSGEEGFNIILFQVTDVDDKILQNATWDYELVDGIYLPKETTQQNYMRKDGGLSYSKKTSFKNTRINRPVSAETFTYKNLGLKNGDKFVDNIQGKECIYKDGELVETDTQK